MKALAPSVVDASMESGFSVVHNFLSTTEAPRIKQQIEQSFSISGNYRREAYLHTRPTGITGLLRECIDEVHEAYFQAGFTDWNPNRTTYVKETSMAKHQDDEPYKWGTAIVYFSGITHMLLGPTEHEMNQQVILKPGDIIFQRALWDHSCLEFDSYGYGDDTRVWHETWSADGLPRTMLHIGYDQTESVTYNTATQLPVLNAAA